MTSILFQAIAFMFVMTEGILMRKSHLVSDNAKEVVKQMMIYLTLPAVIIVSFSDSIELDKNILILIPVGIVMNLIMVIFGLMITKQKPPATRLLYALTLSGYNGGSFALPFVQSFMPPLGSVAVSVFDIGNAIICTGGSAMFCSEYLAEHRGRSSISSVLKRLLYNPPLITYCVMLPLTLLGIHLPENFLTMLRPSANASVFIAMMVLGLTFHMEFKREYITEIVKIVGLRNLFAAICAAFFYFVQPFEPVVNQALVLVSFAPASTMSIIFVEKYDGNGGMAGAINSVSIVVSVIIMTVLAQMMGLS